jgi:hypothetical protein
VTPDPIREALALTVAALEHDQVPRNRWLIRRDVALAAARAALAAPRPDPEIEKLAGAASDVLLLIDGVLHDGLPVPGNPYVERLRSLIRLTAESSP